MLFVYCLLLLLLLCSQGAVPSDSEVQADVAERDRPAVAGCLLVRISTGNCTADSEHNTDSSLTASPLIKLLFSLYLYMSMYLMYWILDTLGLRMQGEFGVLVLPERVWTEEHVQPHPGTGQRWVWLLWRCLSQRVRFMFDHDPKLIPQIHLQRFSHKTQTLTNTMNEWGSVVWFFVEQISMRFLFYCSYHSSQNVSCYGFSETGSSSQHKHLPMKSKYFKKWFHDVTSSYC